MHFGFALDLSDKDLLNIDLLDQRYTHLYLFVSKTSWRRLQDMSSRRLQDMSSKLLEDFCSVTIFQLPRLLQDVFRDVFKTFSRCLEDVLKTSWKTKNSYAEDVLKTSWRHVLKTSWKHFEDQQMFAGFRDYLLGVFTFLSIWVSIFDSTVLVSAIRWYWVSVMVLS